MLPQLRSELENAWEALDRKMDDLAKTTSDGDTEERFSDGDLAYKISYEVEALEDSEEAIKMLQQILASNDNGTARFEGAG